MWNTRDAGWSDLAQFEVKISFDRSIFQHTKQKVGTFKRNPFGSTWHKKNGFGSDE